MTDAPTGARARARVAMTQEITRVARHHLAERGPAELSLRAVARDLGVVSSAVYRYVESRDQLLTLLLIDAYDALGSVVEEAAEGSAGRPFVERWCAIGRAVRGWSVAAPHEHALVFGSPVPGYAAPQDTVPAAMRSHRASLAVVAAGVASGQVADEPERLAREVRRDLERIADQLEVAVPAPVLARALQEWTWLIGHLSFELFGHLEGGIGDREGFFDLQLARSARRLAEG